MECKSYKQEATVVILVTGRIDAVTAKDFEQECGSWTAQGENRMIVDLSGLEYISSAGLRSFLVVGKQIKAAGGTLTLAGMQGMVQEVFDISGFTTLFPAYPSLEKALEAAG